MRLVNLAQFLAASVVSVQAAFDWENVRIGGGGGFIPGIVFHPTTPGLAYLRTDIGGLYKLNADDSWTPLTDGIADSDNWHNWGIDALAVDANDPDKVYCAVGMYTNDWDPSNGAIIRSSDQGQTWDFFDLPFKVGGNMPGRGMGERLAVDPSNSNIIYFGARSGNGLWKSVDAGVSFTEVTSFTWPGTYIPDPTDTYGYSNDIQGLAFITFDTTSGTTSGATSRIFVGTADVDTSIYVSEDAGATWTAVADQPTGFLPHKCKLQPEEGSLYLSYSDGSGPYDGEAGAVYRYDIATATWTDITPSADDLYFGFGGLAVDMQVPGTIVVASLNSWWPDAQLFRSVDSGATWSPLWEWAAYPEMTYYYDMTTEKAPWIDTGFISQDTKKLGWMIEVLEINPHDSDHWLYGTGLSVFGGHDLTSWDSVHSVSIESLADGIEEFAVLEMVSLPGSSELLAAVGDDCGFTFASASDLGTSPQTPWMTPMWTSSTGVDYAGNNPSAIVRVGNTEGDYNVALSNDAGASWNINYGTDQTKYGGTVAYSADGSTILWSSSNEGVLRSQHQSTFTTVTSLDSGAIVVSDKREGDYFYAATGSALFVSSDIGVTFTAAGAVGDATSIRDIVASPDVGGEIYVSTDIGIFHSTDFGSSFTPVSDSVTDTWQVSFGLGPSGNYYLYTFGVGTNGPRLYASADLGGSWVDIQGSVQTFGAIDSARLVGSLNEAGMVYVGTNGRGVFVAQGSVEGGPLPTTTAEPPTTTEEPTTTDEPTTVEPTTTEEPTITEEPTTTTDEPTTTPPETTVQPTGVIPQWGQCGGLNYNGITICLSPYTCTYMNDWYSQCL